MLIRRLSVLFSTLLLVSAGNVLAEEGVGGIATPQKFITTQPSDRLAPIRIDISIDDLVAKDRRVKPSETYKDAAHVINGVALRNRTSGTIHLRGVEQGSEVKQAFLYWNFSDGDEKGADEAPILINGNRVNGRKVADNEDPCWGMAGNHTYRADVTQYVPMNQPNSDYVVVPQFDQMTSTTGRNPWSPIEAQDVRTEGAHLIVIYGNENTVGSQVAVYDDLSGTEFSGNLQLSLAHPTMGAGPALFSMCGADGQRGFGHDNFLSNETSWFNGVQIAGPPVTNSDWDGSDGWPLPQLADTHTHHVRLAAGASRVEYFTNGDCLVPVAFVIEGQ